MQNKKLNVLIGCEFSQTVTKEFRELGHEAFSCDIEPCGGENSEWHLQMDVLEAIKMKEWDIGIFHPPCTLLCCTGNKWMKPEYKDRFPTRQQDREDAIEFFMNLINAPINHIAVENPIGIMSSHYRKPDQIIHPWMFGHRASKSTCLWLKNLPKLIPSEIVDKGEFITYKSGKRIAKWYADAANNDAKTRAKIRNTTFPGIAKQMAIQWSEFILKEKQND